MTDGEPPDGEPPDLERFATADRAEATVTAPDGSVLFVRPHGASPGRPVACRVGDRACFVGNRLAATGSSGKQFDHVLTLTPEPTPATTRHRPLVDGPDNEWTAFAAAADAALECLRSAGTLLVHCAAGVSRSAAVLAAAVAVAEDRTVASALDAVQAARPHAVPHPALHWQAVCYAAAGLERR